MNKKRVIFGLVLALVLGFGIYTFANPRNDDTENNDIVKPAQQENTQEETPVEELQEGTATQAPVQVAPVAQAQQQVPAVDTTEEDERENARLLAEAKEKAIAELKDYKKDYVYSEENQEVYNGLIDEYSAKINNSTTLDEVANNLQDGKDAIDELINSDLAEAKTTAKDEIDNYNAEVLYNDENQEAVDQIKQIAKDEIDNANTREEIEQIVTNAEEEIDKIQKLVETTFAVRFIGFNGKVLDTQEVLYNESAAAPQVADVESKNGVKYTFTGWDKEFANITEATDVTATYEVTGITAEVFYGFKKLANVELKVSDQLVKMVNANKNNTLFLKQSKIESMVNGTLPVDTKLNHKYVYNTVRYVKNVGFFIDAVEVIDQEALARNTVKITYVVEGNASFWGGITNYTTTSTNGYNRVDLPKVYRNGKEAHVIWTDTNGELKEGYNKSITLIARLDKTAPVLTLNGDLEKTVYIKEGVGSYVEAGFNVSDNYDRLTAKDVRISVTRNGRGVFGVNYQVPGRYVITYKVTDTEGNKAEATRVINVLEWKVVDIELSRNNDQYVLWDDANEITVNKVYNDGERVLLEEYTTDTTIDTNSVGSKQVVYTYGEFSATYNYEVVAPIASYITLSRNNDTYNLYDNMNEVTVTLYYSNTDKTTVLDASEYTVNGSFDSNTVGSKSITYTYGELTPVVYNYTVGYSQAQLNYAVKGIKPVLKNESYYSGVWLFSDYIEDYRIIFNHLPEGVSIKSIIQTTDNLFNHSTRTINSLTARANRNEFNLSSDDYDALRGNNSFFAGQYIHVTYTANGVDSTVTYEESFGDLD